MIGYDAISASPISGIVSANSSQDLTQAIGYAIASGPIADNAICATLEIEIVVAVSTRKGPSSKSLFFNERLIHPGRFSSDKQFVQAGDFKSEWMLP